MKTKVASLIFLAFFCAAQAHGQTQLELNESAGAKADAVKKKANKCVRTLATKYAKVKGFKNKMDEAQELYDNYITAHINERFPVPKGVDDRELYGSIEGLCIGEIRTDMYTARLKELNDWSKTEDKGDLASLKKEYEQADKKLNEVYVKVKTGPASKGRTGPTFKKNLTDAEVTWIAFRNTDSEAYGLSGGSETFKLKKMTELTRNRTKQLKEWIDGAEEGDTCAGSIQLKN
ncbi:MAG: DUF1311 domain-containing protein [Candidatus Melainabacteria bacterium]|nr:DUF1311 domain-containing protein [Candidatus Melainabacteria bacterium]